MGERRGACRGLVEGGNVRDTEHLGDLGIDGRTILKGILKKEDGGTWSGLMCFRITKWRAVVKLSTRWGSDGFLRTVLNAVSQGRVNRQGYCVPGMRIMKLTYQVMPFIEHARVTVTSTKWTHFYVTLQLHTLPLPRANKGPWPKSIYLFIYSCIYSFIHKFHEHSLVSTPQWQRTCNSGISSLKRLHVLSSNNFAHVRKFITLLRDANTSWNYTSCFARVT